MAMTNDQAKELLKITKDLNALSKIEIGDAKLRKDAEREISETIQMQSDRLSTINEIKKSGIVLTGQELADFEAINNLYNNQIVSLRKLTIAQKENNKLVGEEVERRKKILGYLGEAGSLIKSTWAYLQSQDKVIKSTILNLGMSGTKAAEMRLSFQQSSQYASILGGSIEDVQKIQEGFADETGRARVLSGEMLKSVIDIGRGTGLGIEQATKLAAQFESMGIDANSAMDYTKGIVETSERMGVNTTKVLKNISDNYKKLNTFTFQKGAKGIADMAMNAERTKVSMESVLNVAEATRGLDKVIELGANLQVMGGEFAKMDPFQWLYISRNEPEKMTDKISEMTRGIFTLKKNSEGVFERFISPEDRDRLANVAKSLGISNEEMFGIAQRRLDLDKMSKDLGILGLTKEQQKLIAGASILNQQTGKYSVMLGGQMRDINTLTKGQVDSFILEKKSLEDKAKLALTFDESLKATINALKAGLLPLLNGVNWLLDKLTPMFKWIGSFGTGGAITALIAGAAVWKGVAFLLSTASKNWLATGSMLKSTGGKTGGAWGNFLGRGSGAPPPQARGANGRIIKGGGGANAGKGLMRGGAGIGAAALGIGAGIGLAAVGIAQLAEAMAKLDKTQIWALPATVFALGAAVLAFTVPLTFLAPELATAGWGLAGFGAAALGIGAGIGIAAAGIGYMAEGLGNLVKNSKGAGKDFLMVAGGIAGIAASMALFTLSGIGILAFAGVMSIVVASSIAAAHVANSMERMGTAMKGTKDDWVAVQNAITAISGANTKGGGMLAELANLLRSPLKVEFANKEVAVVSNITMEIDGEKLFQKTYRPVAAVESTNNAKIFGIYKS